MRSRRSILKSSRRKRVLAERKRRISLFAAAALALVLAVGLLAWLSGNSNILINDININGNSVIRAADMEKAVEDELNGRYLYLFDKKNILIYPKNKLKEKLLSSFARIKDINIYRSSLTSLSIDISERPPSYLWCGVVYDDGLSKKSADGRYKDCYFADETGYIFAKAPYFSGNVFFELYGPVPKEDGGVIGEYFLPEGEFSRLVLFKDAVEGSGVDVASLIVREDGDYSFRSKNGVNILFNKNADFDTLLDNLNSISGEILFDNVLEYIDLRFGNKVFYK